MTLRCLRMPLLLAALWVAGGSLASGHPMQGAAAATGHGSRMDFPFAASLSLVTAGFAIAGIGVWLWARRHLRPPKRRVARRSAASQRWLAGGLLLLLLWILPWLSLHSTHHAMEPGEAACPIAQIVHGQFGGISQSPPTLVLPLEVAMDAAAEPPAPPSRSAPQPAARSPPA